MIGAAHRALRLQRRASAELPLLVGGLPVFSREWGARQALRPGRHGHADRAAVPIAIGRVNFGRDITYERDPNYWARDLDVRRGMYNFDRITYKIYKDNTAQTEAFKAGEFDYMRSLLGARLGAAYTSARSSTAASSIKAELPSKNAGDFQGYLHQHAARQVQGPRACARRSGSRSTSSG